MKQRGTIKNPNAKAELEHLPPDQLVESIIAKEKQILGLMEEIKTLVARGPG